MERLLTIFGADHSVRRRVKVVGHRLKVGRSFADVISGVFGSFVDARVVQGENGETGEVIDTLLRMRSKVSC